MIWKKDCKRESEVRLADDQNEDATDETVDEKPVGMAVSL